MVQLSISTKVIVYGCHINLSSWWWRFESIVTCNFCSGTSQNFIRRVILAGLDWNCLMTKRPSGHISRRTQVNESHSCFHSLNKLLKPDYIVQVWVLVEVNKTVIPDRRIPLLTGIPLSKCWELSEKDYSMSQLSSIPHDIPVTLHTPPAYGQCSVFDHNGDKQSAVLGARYGTWWTWPIRRRVITTSSALVMCWYFFGGPSGGFTRYISLPCTATSHLVWTNSLNGIHQWLQICIMDTSRWV